MLDYPQIVVPKRIMPCLYHRNVQRGLPNIYLREVAIFCERFVQKLHSLKIDGWKMKFPFGYGVFSGAKIFVSGRLSSSVSVRQLAAEKQHPPRNLDVEYFL